MFFEFDYDFDASARDVWDALIDWKGHEDWIYSTHVEVHAAGDTTAVGAEFTAWSGPLPTTAIGQRLSLEDRMQVAELHFDETSKTGRCRVTKLGPTLGGWAEFTVAPSANTNRSSSPGAQLRWTENVTIDFLPRFLAPVLARLGVLGFRFCMRRLAAQLRTQDQRQVTSA